MSSAGAAAVAAALLLGAGKSAATEPDVVEYQVDVRVDLEAEEIRGTERIQLRSAGAPLDTVVFPRNGIEVIDVRLVGDGRPHHWVTADTIEVRLPRPLAGGRTASIEFSYVARSPRGVTFGLDQVHTAFFSCHWMICQEDPDCAQCAGADSTRIH